jgi:hypothetical protein
MPGHQTVRWDRSSAIRRTRRRLPNGLAAKIASTLETIIGTAHQSGIPPSSKGRCRNWIGGTPSLTRKATGRSVVCGRDGFRPRPSRSANGSRLTAGKDAGISVRMMDRDRNGVVSKDAFMQFDSRIRSSRRRQEWHTCARRIAESEPAAWQLCASPVPGMRRRQPIVESQSTIETREGGWLAAFLLPAYGHRTAQVSRHGGDRNVVDSTMGRNAPCPPTPRRWWAAANSMRSRSSRGLRRGRPRPWYPANVNLLPPTFFEGPRLGAALHGRLLLILRLRWFVVRKDCASRPLLPEPTAPIRLAEARTLGHRLVAARYSDRLRPYVEYELPFPVQYPEHR